MSSEVPAAPTASGDRAIGINHNTGTAISGDHARVTQVSAGALRAPDQVPMPARLEGLPRAPADPFVGREDALSALEQALDRQGASVVTQAVFGLGGVGKSELALQYAARFSDRYPLIWWAPAENDDVLQESLARLARKLEPTLTLVGATTVDTSEWVMQWLQCHSGWLLIVDNVEEHATVAPLLGRIGRHGHVVITTRRDISWRGSARPLPLDVLSVEAAIALLADLVGSDGEPKALAELAAELGNLPLALEQAGAYIAEQRINPGRYLGLLRETPMEAFEGVDQSGDAARTIARVWDITLAVIREREESAARLLEVLAYFAPDAIARHYLTSASDDPRAVDRALGVLASYSLVALEADFVSLHRLVRAVVQEKVKRAYRHVDPAAIPAAEAARILNRARPAGNPQVAVEEWPQWRELVPHIDALTQAVTDEQAGEPIASLLAASGFFAWTQGQHHAALPRDQRALRINEAALGPDHPTVATLLGNLAATLKDLGRADEALPLAQQALQINETAHGPNHPTVATRLDNIATSLMVLGRADEALPLQQRALEISETALGPNHPTVATRLNNLAATLKDLGRADEALPLAQQALQINETAHGPNHPTVATRLSNLANTLTDIGRADEALPLAQRALQISETALGPNHPTVATRLGNLAACYYGLGKTGEAVKLCRRAVQIADKALPNGHPTAVWLQGFLEMLQRA